ncbi:MAG: exopolyphosphatase [Lachnospiraceae bacterium]|nr:exopolyphosphatase [Lachnospiraceae bacterium]
MAVKTFAAIDVGSYELAMKIFEISKRNGIREIDLIRHSIELGTDTYNNGKIRYERVDELCAVLKEFAAIMDSYGVDAYKAYGTSAIRETENTIIILDQIQNRTGIRIEVLSNSEQRFLDYKSIASKGEGFLQIIEKGTIIIDIGGGSIQLSLFDKDTLIATQNIRLGVLRMRERLQKLAARTNHYEELIGDMVSAQLQMFKKMYLKDREIKNIIIVDDHVSNIMQRKDIFKEATGYLTTEEFMRFVEGVKRKGLNEIAQKFGLTEENASLMFHSIFLIKSIVEVLEAELLWAPGVSLCDGIAYEYAENNRLITLEHDFEKDILACALNISKRYMVSKRRSETVEHISLVIFDAMKKIHGLGKRERLLLQIAAQLNDCGRYISLVNVGECSYSIIMATEIMGLSHAEQEMVANIVRFNRMEFSYYEELTKENALDKKNYLTIAKLTAILRVATGMDRSHKQKFKDVQARLHERELILSTDTLEDITLEKGLLTAKTRFFQEVFSVKVSIRQRRRL